MATQYLYPTPRELREIDQAYMASLQLNDPIFKLFPIAYTRMPLVTWRQRDNYAGLMQIRGINGAFPSVPEVGMTEYIKQPGYYGEHSSISEQDLTLRASGLRDDVPVDITDLVNERDRQLLVRQNNRMSNTLWTLLKKGAYEVRNKAGAIVDRDTYPIQQVTSSPAWSDLANAKPLADLRAVNLTATGTSAQFGPAALALMNLQTFYWLAGNGNAADLGGKKGQYGQSVIGLGEINRVTLGEGLPQIQIWNEGYYDESTGSYVQWLGDGEVIVVGSRMNSVQVGEFLMTRNVNNPGESSQPYVKVVDTGTDPKAPPPRRIDVYRGFNGGPAVYYPGSVVFLKAA